VVVVMVLLVRVRGPVNVDMLVLVRVVALLLV
jgi:hypothetical protein